MSPAARAATLTARRSTRFVAWTRSWRAGLVPYDDCVDEITGDEEHLAADVPSEIQDEVPLRQALSLLSKLHPDEIRVVLPAAGDPRGLPGPGPFTQHALLSEEGVVASRLGFVPEVRQHVSGSGDEFSIVVWRVFSLPQVAAAAHVLTAAEAEGELSEALAVATAQLIKLDVAQWRPELGGALAQLRKPDTNGELPPGYDQRARRLYARASVLDRVLTLASEAAPGGAVNAFEAARRDEALRPLMSACRRALVAACNAPLI
jgi:hypothetical protein